MIWLVALHAGKQINLVGQTIVQYQELTYIFENEIRVTTYRKIIFLF